MAMKLMLLPSVRSKFVKDENMKLIYRTLLVLSVIMIISNYYMYSFMYAVKLALMIVVAIIATVETEILFYSHDKNITREVSKDLIQKSYPKITALIYVLLIPVGTPLWLVAIGAIMGTMFGKLLFGGFHHMIFHTSLVGVMFVTLGWSQLSLGVDFITAFDNYIIELIFNNDFFNNTLALKGDYDPANMTSAIGMLTNGTPYKTLDVLLGITPGIIVSGLALIVAGGFLIYKKAINWVTPLTTLLSFTFVAVIIALVNGQSMLYPLQHVLTGSLLFVLLFVVSDPITTPIPLKGKIIYGVIAGALAMFIRNGIKYEEGIIFGVLFMSMLTPMINQELKKKPVKKTPPKKVETVKEGV